MRYESPCSLPRRTALAATAAVATLVLAACGGGNSAAANPAPGTTTTASVSVRPGPHNQADVTFAQHMIVHHCQAIEMAKLAQTHASSSEVKALAAKIEKEQAPEIQTMSAWLTAWGEPVPQGMPGESPGSPSAMPGGPSCMPGEHSAMPGGPSAGMMSGGPSCMPGGPSAMPGMMSDQQMHQMMHASGHSFDTMFLTMMIEHHQGAVEMARTEQAQGLYGPAKALAADIIATQTAEIGQMQKMLATP